MDTVQNAATHPATGTAVGGSVTLANLIGANMPMIINVLTAFYLCLLIGKFIFDRYSEYKNRKAMKDDA